MHLTDIPNVLAEQFNTSRKFAESLLQQTGSQPIAELLRDAKWSDLTADKISYEFLVELLAFQFASPVRWIETQNLLFGALRTERLIEIGPAPTLFTMAKRTLETFDTVNPYVQREILWYNRDKSKIYFDAPETMAVAEPISVASAPVAPVATPVVAAAAPTGVSAQTLPEEAPSALDFIHVITAQKTKQSLSAIRNDASLKSISAGKSALQNELQGELEAEFESSKAALQSAGNISEMPFSQLATLVQTNYKQPGKRSADLVNKSLARVLPGGYSPASARKYLGDDWGLATAIRQHNVFVVGLSIEPSSRLSSPAAAEEWLDKAATLYASKRGITLQKGAASAPVAQAAPVAAGPVVGAAASIPDQPPSALDAMRSVIAIKMKKPFDAVSPSATLKELSAGKSALQNEVVGDLIKEFSVKGEPNGVTEMDLASLASALTAKSPYARLGPVTAPLVARLLSSKMPAGFSNSSVRGYLKSQYGLGDGRADGVMLMALPNEPASRLATEADARQFWDSMSQQYAKNNGIDLQSSVRSSGTVQLAAGAMVDPKVRSDLQALFERQIRAFKQFIEPEGSQSDHGLVASLRTQLNDLESSMRLWNDEHGGSAYFEGLNSVFDSRKERMFDSYWAWVRQDCLSLYYDYACGRAPAWNLEVRNRIYHIKNRSTPHALQMVEYYKTKAQKDGFPEIVRFISMLHEALSASLAAPARYRELLRPQKPSVSIDSTGAIVYKEIDRPESKDMIQYVEEMIRGRPVNLDSPEGEKVPYIFVQQSVSSKVPIDAARSENLFNVLRKIAVDGVGFTGKVALVTGCGEGSIGLEVLKALLSGGATVYATTSRFDGERVAQLYQQAYNDRGAKGSKLILLPFNQASKSDIDNLIERIPKSSFQGQLSSSVAFVSP